MTTSRQQSHGVGEGFDGLPGQIAGISKQQLYGVMSRMKTVIDNDQEHAREVLINNPALTCALFQAQILLGMVKDPKESPEVLASTQSQPLQVAKTTIVQSMLLSSGHPGIQDHTTLPQPPTVSKQQNIAEPSRSFLSASDHGMSFQPPTMPANHPQPSQVKEFHLPQLPSVATPQSSQLLNVTLPHLPPQYSTFPSQAPMVSTQQQLLRNHRVFNQQLQPPLPQMPRPASMQSFPHQIQVPNSLGLHPSSAPQQLLPQSVFHAGGNPHAPLPTGQPALPNQLPPQQLYQGGSHMSHMGVDYNFQNENSMQIDRSAPWLRVHQDASASGVNFPGQLPVIPGQMTRGVGGSQPHQHQKQFTPEMEKALIQQVLIMTPEQVSLLPAEQRPQVLHLQEMLRH